MTDRVMTVGELSRRTGVPIKTLRAYTDAGLVCSLGRSPTNYRLYAPNALWCLRQIATLRGLGLTVAEIGDLTRAGRGDGGIGWRLADRLAASRRRLEARIAEARQALARLDAFEQAHHAELTGRAPLRDGDPCPGRRSA